jgi:hypothetical protein
MGTTTWPPYLLFWPIYNQEVNRHFKIQLKTFIKTYFHFLSLFPFPFLINGFSMRHLIFSEHKNPTVHDFGGMIVISYVMCAVVSKSFRTGRLERELQMVQLSAAGCSCIAII